MKNNVGRTDSRPMSCPPKARPKPVRTHARTHAPTPTAPPSLPPSLPPLLITCTPSTRPLIHLYTRSSTILFVHVLTPSTYSSSHPQICSLIHPLVPPSSYILTCSPSRQPVLPTVHPPVHPFTRSTYLSTSPPIHAYPPIRARLYIVYAKVRSISCCAMGFSCFGSLSDCPFPCQSP